MPETNVSSRQRACLYGGPLTSLSLSSEAAIVTGTTALETDGCLLERLPTRARLARWLRPWFFSGALFTVFQ